MEISTSSAFQWNMLMHILAEVAIGSRLEAVTAPTVARPGVLAYGHGNSSDKRGIKNLKAWLIADTRVCIHAFAFVASHFKVSHFKFALQI